MSLNVLYQLWNVQKSICLKSVLCRRRNPTVFPQQSCPFLVPTKDQKIEQQHRLQTMRSGRNCGLETWPTKSKWRNFSTDNCSHWNWIQHICKTGGCQHHWVMVSRWGAALFFHEEPFNFETGWHWPIQSWVRWHRTLVEDLALRHRRHIPYVQICHQWWESAEGTCCWWDAPEAEVCFGLSLQRLRLRWRDSTCFWMCRTRPNLMFHNLIQIQRWKKMVMAKTCNRSYPKQPKLRFPKHPKTRLRMAWCGIPRLSGLVLCAPWKGRLWSLLLLVFCGILILKTNRLDVMAKYHQSDTYSICFYCMSGSFCRMCNLEWRLFEIDQSYFHRMNEVVCLHQYPFLALPEPSCMRPLLGANFRLCLSHGKLCCGADDYNISKSGLAFVTWPAILVDKLVVETSCWSPNIRVRPSCGGCCLAQALFFFFFCFFHSTIAFIESQAPGCSIMFYQHPVKLRLFMSRIETFFSSRRMTERNRMSQSEEILAWAPW